MVQFVKDKPIHGGQTVVGRRGEHCRVAEGCFDACGATPAEPMPFEVRTVDFVLNLRSDVVEEAMSPDPVCVETHTSVREVLQLLKQHASGAVLVCRACVLAGIFTERDALRLMAGNGSFDQTVDQVMTPNPVSLKRGDSLATAIRKMSAGGYRHLPIVDHAGIPLGIVKVQGIVRYLVEHFPQAVYNLPPEPQLQGREGA